MSLQTKAQPGPEDQITSEELAEGFGRRKPASKPAGVFNQHLQVVQEPQAPDESVVEAQPQSAPEPQSVPEPQPELQAPPNPTQAPTQVQEPLSSRTEILVVLVRLHAEGRIRYEEICAVLDRL